MTFGRAQFLYVRVSLTAMLTPFIYITNHNEKHSNKNSSDGQGTCFVTRELFDHNVTTTPRLSLTTGTK